MIRPESRPSPARLWLSVGSVVGVCILDEALVLNRALCGGVGGAPAGVSLIVALGLLSVALLGGHRAWRWDREQRPSRVCTGSDPGEAAGVSTRGWLRRAPVRLVIDGETRLFPGGSVDRVPVLNRRLLARATLVMSIICAWRIVYHVGLAWTSGHCM